MPKLWGRRVHTVLATFLCLVLSFVGCMDDLVQRLAVNRPGSHSSRYRHVYRGMSFHRKLLRLNTSTEFVGKPDGLVDATVWQHDEEFLTAMAICCASVEGHIAYDPLERRQYRLVHDGLRECRVQPLEIVDVEKDYTDRVPRDRGSFGGPSVKVTLFLRRAEQNAELLF